MKNTPRHYTPTIAEIDWQHELPKNKSRHEWNADYTEFRIIITDENGEGVSVRSWYLAPNERSIDKRMLAHAGREGSRDLNLNSPLSLEVS